MNTKNLVYVLIVIIFVLLTILYILLRQCQDICSKKCDAKISAATSQFTPFTDALRQQIMLSHNLPARTSIEHRDRRVLEDPLYPPLNRTIHPVAEANQTLVQQRALQQPTRTGTDVDTFRLLGYFVNSENKTDVWKLFGRQLYSRGSQGTFYVMPTDRNNDVKIPLDSNSDIVEPRLRDLYNLPNEVRFKHPMFSPTATYQFVELKSGDPVSAIYF